MKLPKELDEAVFFLQAHGWVRDFEAVYRGIQRAWEDMQSSEKRFGLAVDMEHEVAFWVHKWTDEIEVSMEDLHEQGHKRKISYFVGGAACLG